VAQDVGRFFAENFPIIRAKCARLLGDTEEAADVAQEAFVRLCGSPVAHEPPAARLKWIYVTGTRLCIDLLRRRRQAVEVAGQGGHDALEGPSGAPSIDVTLGARQLLLRLAAALSDRELEVLVLSRCDRMTQEEIAAVMGLSSRQVRRIITSAETAAARVERTSA
jgi:RNA polymerase sigma-70 factor, ECF subfamily